MNIVSNMAVFSSQREVFGLPVCDLDWSEAFSFVSALADVPIGQTVISFLNAHNANIMLKDPDYRETLERHLVLPDGIGVDLASLAAFGKTFPANLNGTDFVPALLTYMTTPKRIGMVGAKPEVLRRARAAFEAHAPWHEFIAVSDGYFGEENSAELAKEITRHKLDILLVAMGTPRQEKWIDRYIRPEHARLVIGVGALFDFVGGEVPRAPEHLRRLRVEWLFRFMQEPRRLAARYFVGGPRFVGHILANRASYHLGTLKRALS
ncbi:WecB/TagA/CpsF family glycosyltransferase [Rhizobium sp. KVB221]|uniref:WecB/TagA/CpsF family glycosyltransferase n=1 Tax=Rhizobium setariae TaxID=2801340 RepID=A0A936YM43_9HYPH|nr:WecB/TagA/CpsF family glycosyltransferase [Rhizobium setariae]MBL0370706.1 WecB/TagA/CpsF family glycosyltransferase [Rhizobium setariae]